MFIYNLHLHLLDINECLDWCRGANAHCKNTVGSYDCICMAGFEFNKSTHNCEGQFLFLPAKVLCVLLISQQFIYSFYIYIYCC